MAKEFQQWNDGDKPISGEVFYLMRWMNRVDESEGEGKTPVWIVASI